MRFNFLNKEEEININKSIKLSDLLFDNYLVTYTDSDGKSQEEIVILKEENNEGLIIFMENFNPWFYKASCFEEYGNSLKRLLISDFYMNSIVSIKKIDIELNVILR